MVRFSHSGFGNRRVAVDHHRLAAILRGPVVADRQAELVGLAGGLAVEREVAHLARAAALHLLLHAGVRHHQLAVVEHVMADQAVEELGDLLPELRRLLLELLQRLGQPVRDLHVLAPQLAHQLHVVVAGHAERRSGLDHAHHQPQHVGNLRPAVHQVAEEDRLATLRRMVDAEIRSPSRSSTGRSRAAQQLAKLVEAAVDVADDVERAVLVLAVVPQRLALDLAAVDLLRRLQNMKT